MALTDYEINCLKKTVSYSRSALSTNGKIKSEIYNALTKFNTIKSSIKGDFNINGLAFDDETLDSISTSLKEAKSASDNFNNTLNNKIYNACYKLRREGIKGY